MFLVELFGVRIGMDSGIPERSQHAHAGAVVPDGGRDFAARPGDAAKLGERLAGIGDEVEHEQGEGGIEAGIRETQLLRIAHLKAGASGEAIPAGGVSDVLL